MAPESFLGDNNAGTADQENSVDAAKQEILDFTSQPLPLLGYWPDDSSKLDLPHQNGSVDRIILGSEILSRDTQTELIPESHRVLRTGGTITFRSDLEYESRNLDFDPTTRTLSAISEMFRLDSFDVRHGVVELHATKDQTSSNKHHNTAAIVAAAIESLRDHLRKREELSETLARTAHELQIAESRVENAKVSLFEKDGQIREQRLLNTSQLRKLEERSSQVASLKNKESKLKSRLAGADNHRKKTEGDLDRTRAQLINEQVMAEYQRWRASSLENSKWSRIAQQLMRARRPWLLPNVIYRIVSIVLGRSFRPPMPKKPPRQAPVVEAIETKSRLTGQSPRKDEITPFNIPDSAPRRRLRVATILDEFSELAFKYEVEVLPIPRKEWHEFVDQERPDLILVESAWNANGGDWKYAFAGPTAPKQDVVDLAAFCREIGVPTIFWNKEDPLEYDEFLASASHFDWVFTVDADCVPRYKAALGHERVDVLPFAVQPRLHNPVREMVNGRKRGVAFAGTYYSGKYPERKRQIEDLLTPCLDLGLEIYSRFDGSSKYRFPDPLNSAVVGSLDYRRMLSAYREHKVFLNVNSVVDSPTMFSRRVLELLACGTPVVSGPSPGMTALIGRDAVDIPTDRDDARLTVRALLGNGELRDRKAVVGIRAVMDGNTYSDRVDHLLGRIGMEVDQSTPRVSVLAPTNRPGGVEAIIESVGRQNHKNVELILGIHGIEYDKGRIKEHIAKAGIEEFDILHAPREWSLGRVLNELVERAGGDYLAKMDDDDVYGERYLSDQLLVFNYADADIVGKWTRHVYLERSRCLGVLFPGHEHRFSELVGGGTILARRDVFEAVTFADCNIGEDSQFLRECKAVGLRTYSTDRFNFVYVRHDGESSHTHAAGDRYHMANMNIVAFDQSLESAFV